MMPVTPRMAEVSNVSIELSRYDRDLLACDLRLTGERSLCGQEIYVEGSQVLACCVEGLIVEFGELCWSECSA